MSETAPVILTEAHGKRVLEILLAAKGSCLHTPVNENGLVTLCADGPQHFAIEQIIEHFGRSEALADLVANAYLDRFDKQQRGLFAHTDALEYAYRIAMRFPLSAGVADRFIRSVATAGWYGRLESLAHALRQRDPTPEEVVFLFDSYVPGAFYSTSTDERLSEYARTYMAPKDARAQIARIKERNERAKYD